MATFILNVKEGKTYCEDCLLAVWNNDECNYQCGGIGIDCNKYDLNTMEIVQQD